MSRYFLFVAGLFFLGCQVVFCNENSLNRDKDSKLQYAFFQDHIFHSLDVPTIDEAYVLTGRHCLLRCVKNQRCFSTNIAVSSTQDGTVLCQLLSSDKYNSSSNFAQSQAFHHYSIVSPCESFPCQHGGTCQALYERNDYSCNCTENYFGKIVNHFANALRWSEAKKRCEEMDGSLVILNSLEEDEFLYTEVLPQVPQSYEAWIGLREIGSSKPRIWKWVDGSIPTFTKWGSNDPSHTRSHCVTAAVEGSNMGWNDRRCSKTFGFVCEKKQNQPQ
ncbi:Collectin-12 [Desmophyllum pertusum]|uniref:Collectin-12 n=1 Tax=Desmophyllum pertusum TaxID=174260 RepID=A0A9W9YJU6_9CNID|nr:Collectin-12 [Desmophyllum pertusum]